MSDHHASEQAEPGHHALPGGLDADEPQTPYWLTALGGALFLSAAVFFLVTAKDDADAAAPAQGPAAADSATAPGHPADEPPSEE